MMQLPRSKAVQVHFAADLEEEAEDEALLSTSIGSVEEELRAEPEAVPTASWMCHRQQLVYNRVPKCGSSTVIGLLSLLRERNGFGLVADLNNDFAWRDDEGRASLDEVERSVNLTAACSGMASQASGRPPSLVTPDIESLKGPLAAGSPFAFVRHMGFLDIPHLWQQRQLGEPIGSPADAGGCLPRYINVDRDPVGKCVSNYYFEVSYLKHLAERQQKGSDFVLQGRVDINECVAVAAGWQERRQGVDPRAYDVCLNFCLPMGQQSWIHYCGFHEDCRQLDRPLLPNQNPSTPDAFRPFNATKAYARARANVEGRFALVGITSMMNETVEALEYVLPEFFAGGHALMEELHRVNGSTHFRQSLMIRRDGGGHAAGFHIEPTARTREWLEEQMSDAMGFYRWLEARFVARLDELRAANTTTSSFQEAASGEAASATPCP